MGYFDNFFREEKKNSDGVSHILTEMNKQASWIKKIHSFSRDLHNYTQDIQRSNTKHKREIIGHINMLTKWIDYLNTSNNELKQEVQFLKKNIRKELRADFEKYHSVLMSFIELKLLEEKKDREKIKSELISEMKAEIAAQKKPADNTFSQFQDNEHEPIIKIKEPIKSEPELTNPENALLNLLFNEGTPMTYEDMAVKLGKSVSSIRVYLNSLKYKRDIIEEFKKPNGTKIFSIKNSQMIKTLFNLI